mgnify:FL=1
MPGIFISGSDTGVGKTLISAGLVRLARKRGINCVGIKPVETGCPVKNGMLEPLDGRILWEAGDKAFSLDECAPYRFNMPAAPFRAAAMEDSNLNASDIVEHILTVSDGAEMSVVEGAGGLMTPVDDKKSMIDIIADLQYPTLLVARLALGTINHSILSIEALQSRNIDVKGVVLSASSREQGPEEEYTPGDLERILRDIPVVVFPFLEDTAEINPDRIAESMIANWTGSFIDHLLCF